MSDLSDKCCEIYANARDGQQAVEKFIRDNHPGVPWGWCVGCENEEPHEDRVCLVCGTLSGEEKSYQCIDPNCPSVGTYHDHGDES